MSHQVLTFINDTFSFHNGLKHLCSLKLVSILGAALWKVVIKCKNVMFFFTFWALFLKMLIFQVAKFYLTKYQISNQLIFLVVVCICIMLLIGQLHPKSYKISETGHPYLMDIFDIFTSGRYHRDMKILKTLTSKSKHFRFHGSFKKWQFDTGPAPADSLNTIFFS